MGRGWRLDEYQVTLKSTVVNAMPAIATVDNGIDCSNALG
jgi:hypothetical protein